MSNLVEKLWPHTKVCTFIAIALVAGALYWGLNLYTFGIYVLVGWLLLPLVSYWVMGNHNWPGSFMIKMYPMFIRKLTTFGWLLLCLALSYVWVAAFIQFGFRK